MCKAVALSGYILPALICLSACLALRRRCDVYSLLCEGAAEGLKTLLHLCPLLVILLAGIAMLRASGAMDAIARLCAPVLRAVGIPPELAPLMLVRPFSGSAALAVGADLMRTFGVGSTVGRTAAVMLGSTETTFYTISVYFGAAGIRKTRYAIPAALCADLAGFFCAALFVRLF